VNELATETRVQLAALWQARAQSESSVRSVFHKLVGELQVAGADPRVVEMARRAADDEARHARVCVELAARYRGSAVEPAVEPAVRLPDHVDDRRLRAALHAVNLCCIGETLAVAFVEACLAACEDEHLRDIHARHMADEVRHARIGWAHLASLPAEVRGDVARWVPKLVRLNVEAWTSRIGELPEAGIAGHGYPPRAVLLEAMRKAVDELVLPGFEYAGVAVEISPEKIDTDFAAVC